MPIHKALESIIKEAKVELEEMQELSKKREQKAALVVETAMGKMKYLSEFAETLPQKMLERFSTIMVGEIRPEYLPSAGEITYCELRMNGMSIHLSGLMGQLVKLSGRYRVVTILEKVD